MLNIKEPAILISSCDLYKDAWNPFFRLLEANWKNCPQKIYLVTESEEYKDCTFDVKCIHSASSLWSNRIIDVLKQIDEDYIWFFLEDFFLEEEVNEEIINRAVSTIKNSTDIGVIKFIPNISDNWYDKNQVISDYFSVIPKDYKARSNLMISLYKKDYFLKMLRKKETPWDFEKYGTYRSRKYSEKILVQNNVTKLAFPYNYQIKYGYGISAKKWLKNNKPLFEKYGIQVNFENLGWYQGNEKEKIIGLKRSKKDKLLMPIKDPKMFWKIISYYLKNIKYNITHIRNYF